ncbi:MAG TPA: FecR domain-containing protein [bacterium]|nr:FecR domain-containing protein [bacterium]
MRAFKPAAAVMALFMIVMSHPFSALAAEEGVIDEVRGTVTVESFEGAPRPARAGEYVLAGETIETGPDGFIRVIMGEGSVLELRERSRIEVFDSRADESGTRRIALFLGRMWTTVAGNSEGSTAMEVTTPTSVSGVRGTSFSAGVGLDGATRVGVDKGLVDVSSEQGMVELGAGQETTVEWDQAPAAPAGYNADEEQWRQWVLSRQDQVVKHGKQIVPFVVRDVKKSRQDMVRLKKTGDQRMKRLRDFAEKQKARGKPVRLTSRQKKAIAGYVRDVVGSVRELYISDEKMVTRYYILKQIQLDTQAHPELYDQEFISTVNNAMAELDKLDIEKIHQDNRKIISAYVNGVDEFLKKHRLGRYKEGAPEAQDRRQALKKARQDYNKNK